MSRQKAINKEISQDLIVSDGSREHFFLANGYRYRVSVEQFDDRLNRARWQDYVYETAFRIFRRENLRNVVDIGCGSGFKLLKYFSSVDTTGIELKETIRSLRKSYPNRNWLVAEQNDQSFPPGDLYICSDVIEHVRQPDRFLDRISKSPFRYVVLSTPAREILFADGKRDFLGPPDNIAHFFEWTMGEFHRFVSQYINIEEHIFSYRGEYTQIVVGRQRG